MEVIYRLINNAGNPSTPSKVKAPTDSHSSYLPRGARVSSPPANSFDMLVRLGLMSRYDVQSLGHNSTAYLHRFAEVTKHGFSPS